ncbi:DUF5719 family protein [Microcella sp.]|uniref:DUF5719 family protein n=1 Tax=Microcella sp. TaxID=1913979 RepID=UPI00256CCA66|nr:DUF5719 family protein [Microcella sp.]MBX9472757.1 hypothetical protein [Microcella sp.]
MTDPQTPSTPGTPSPAEPPAATPAVPPAPPAATPELPNVARVAESSGTRATNGDFGGAADAPPEPEPEPRRTRALLAASGRASLALIATGAAAALALGVLFVPSPALAPEPLAITVTPDRSDQSLVCAGAALGVTRGDDPQVAGVALPLRRSAGAGLVESTIAESDALDGTATVVTLPRDAPAEAVAASESVRPTTADVAGLAAAECLTPARSAWLVGGSTTVGRSTWIVLSNAGAVDATVSLRIIAENGPIEAPGTTGIIVAAGEQRVLPLSGIAVNVESPVIEVTSSGGSIAATLQHSVVRGLDPSGISIVTPIDAPATRHVIPALPVINGQAVLERSTADGGADALTALRMLAPGDTPAQVTVRLIPEGDGTGIALTTTLEPQTVVDLPFTDLLDGDYAVVVEASEPIIVAARTSSAGTTGLDLEWFSPAPAMEAGVDVLAAVAPVGTAVTARLHLFAPEGEATVTVDGRTVVVPADGGLVLETATNAAVQLTSTAPLHASVSYRGDAVLAGTRILPPPQAARPVTVLPY